MWRLVSNKWCHELCDLFSQVFSCEYCVIFKNSFFYRTPRLFIAEFSCYPTGIYEFSTNFDMNFSMNFGMNKFHKWICFSSTLIFFLKTLRILWIQKLIDTVVSTWLIHEFCKTSVFLTIHRFNGPLSGLRRFLTIESL